MNPQLSAARMLARSIRCRNASQAFLPCCSIVCIAFIFIVKSVFSLCVTMQGVTAVCFFLIASFYLSYFSHHPLSPPLKGGLMIPWRRRWCVLKDETFMWFRAKQDSLKSGWLYKKGGGMSTLSRRNWKMRWFVLRESKLMYFENDSEEKLKGTIDIRTAK